MKHYFNSVLALFVIVALIFYAGITTSMAQEKTKVSGKETIARVKMESIEVGDVEGHRLVLIQAEGVWEGSPDLMDNARRVSVSIYDLVNGNGPFHGYSKITKDGDVINTRFEGVLTTTPSAKGLPSVTSKGTWSYISGTGSFEGIQGNGTFKGHNISELISISETEGEFFIKK